GEGIAQCLVSGAVGGWLAAIGHQRPVVRETLKSFRLPRRQTSHLGSDLRHRIALPRLAAARLERSRYGAIPTFKPELGAGVLGEGDGELSAGIGMAAAVAHGAKCGGDVASIGAVVFR